MLHLPSDNVMQVWNSSNYCSNDLIYICISENSPSILWDIYDEIRRIVHYAVIGKQTGRRELDQ